MGLVLDPENGFDFNNGNDKPSNDSEANVTAIVLGILCSIFAVMVVFLIIAYVIRVKQ